MAEKTTKEKNNSVKQLLFERFNLYKKAALMEGYLSDGEKKKGESLLRKFNEVVYGKDSLDWEQFYIAMNDMHNGFFDKLLEKYPQLDDTEFRIACLSYVEFSNMDIAIILKHSVNTVHTKRSSIRRKIGIKEYGGDLRTFFDKELLQDK
jgi:DNA-binding CsgD family transcriptional regulator